MNIELPAPRCQRTLPMSPTGTMASVEARRGKLFSAVFSWGNVNAPTGVLTAQVSNDNVTFTAYTGFTFPAQPAGVAGSTYVEHPNFSFNFVRFVYTKTSGGVGDTLTADLASKG